ncbi:MAG TPA: site-specific integrase [Verrucomicrobiae bacterium]
MASLFHRGKIFWIKYNGGASKPIRKSLHLRIDRPKHVQTAEQLLIQYQAKEAKIKANTGADDEWESWVPGFIINREISETTKITYRSLWTTILTFLHERKINCPAELTYNDCSSYLDWRTNQVVKDRKVNLNTAMGEMTLLHGIMEEAIVREFAHMNPAQNLLKRRGKRRPKRMKAPELSDVVINDHRERLKKYPQWMQDQFEIGLHTGFRPSETDFPLATINFEKHTLSFTRRKPERVQVIPYNPALDPIFKRMIANKQTNTLDTTSNHGKLRPNWSLNWLYYSRKEGVKFLFKSLRVTFITRGRRAGVDRATMMQLVGHNSTEVHEIYNRYLDEDVRHALDKITLPSQPEQMAELPSPPQSAQIPQDVFFQDTGSPISHTFSLSLSGNPYQQTSLQAAIHTATSSTEQPCECSSIAHPLESEYQFHS